MHKGAGGTVQVDYDTCSGHGACKDVCPYGAIYIDPVANQAIKCHNCTHRVDVGMEPACVDTCPSGALYFGDLADPESTVSKVTMETTRSRTLRARTTSCRRSAGISRTENTRSILLTLPVTWISQWK